MTNTIHASCVAIDGIGVLLCGPSGSGKSDLALRLLDRGAALVSDDYTRLIPSPDGHPLANAPENIVGKIEVRGLGILDWPAMPQAPVALAILLDSTPERMPADPLPTRDFAGFALPVLALAPFEASTPLKVELALRHQLAARR